MLPTVATHTPRNSRGAAGGSSLALGKVLGALCGFKHPPSRNIPTKSHWRGTGSGIVLVWSHRASLLVRLRDLPLMENLLPASQLLNWGIPATYRFSIDTEAVAGAEKLCLDVVSEFPRVTFFAGKVIFGKERWYHALLHNHTATVLEGVLLLRGGPQIVIVETPWYLSSE